MPPPRYQNTLRQTASLAEPVGVSITFLGLRPTASIGALIRSEGIRSSTGTSTGPARRSTLGSTNGAWTSSWLEDGGKAGRAPPACAEVDAAGDGWRSGWPSLAWALPQAARTVAAISAAVSRPGEPWRANSIAVGPYLPRRQTTTTCGGADLAPSCPRARRRRSPGYRRPAPGSRGNLRPGEDPRPQPAHRGSATKEAAWPAMCFRQAGRHSLARYSRIRRPG